MGVLRLIKVSLLIAVVSAGAWGRQADKAEHRAISPIAPVVFDRLRLERTQCYGECPIYRITIDGTGLVTFEGERFTKQIGTDHWQLSGSDLTRLQTAIGAIRFFELRDEYKYGDDVCPVSETDAPSAIMTITAGGRTKRVEHYYGCVESGISHDVYPRDLFEFASMVDEIVGVNRWLR
jgi:hypothetical protein